MVTHCKLRMLVPTRHIGIDHGACQFSCHVGYHHDDIWLPGFSRSAALIRQLWQHSVSQETLKLFSGRTQIRQTLLQVICSECQQDFRRPKM